MRMYFGIWAMGACLVMAGMTMAQQGPRVDAGGPVIRTGERFGVMQFSIRTNYVYPQEVTVPEGWYRILIDNPHRVTGNAQARLDDERGVAVRDKAIVEKDSRTVFYQRLVPGKHKLRIGTKAEWVVAVTVTAQRL